MTIKGIPLECKEIPSNSWVITAPISSVADQGLAGAAETQVGALSIETMLKTPPPLSEMGLNTPADTLDLVFVSGASDKIEVGIMNPIKAVITFVTMAVKSILLVSQGSMHSSIFDCSTISSYSDPSCYGRIRRTNTRGCITNTLVRGIEFQSEREYSS